MLKAILNKYIILKIVLERTLPTQRNFLERILYAMDVSKYKFAKNYIKGKKVLNAACGEGYSSVILLRCGAKEVQGVDIDKRIISEAKKKYKNPRLKFYCQNAEQLSFPDNYFDAAVSMGTIEYLKSPEKFLKELKRVTKPESAVIISTPNGSITKKNGLLYWSRFHINEFTTSEMATMLKKYFKIVGIYHQMPFTKTKPFIAFKLLYAIFFRYTSIARRKAGITGVENIFICKNEY